MAILKYPYTNLHELNLDWIIEQLNKEGAVLSVNDKHGVVVLTGEDIKRNTTTPETVSQALSSQGTAIQTVRTQIGTTPLPTTAQSLTGAIAENTQKIANVEDNIIGNTALPTEAQTLTGAITENADNIGGNAESITNINNKIGTTTLPTTAQTLTGAIAENAQYIDALNTQISDLHMVQLTKTVTNGYFAISTSEIPVGKKLIIQNCYLTNSNYADLAFAVQANAPGSSNSYFVYVRKGSSNPPDDTSVTVNILYMD